jgi:hypothetical protein
MRAIAAGAVSYVMLLAMGVRPETVPTPDGDIVSMTNARPRAARFLGRLLERLRADAVANGKSAELTVWPSGTQELRVDGRLRVRVVPR